MNSQDSRGNASPAGHTRLDTFSPPARIAVVGGGRMGAGIAHAFLANGSRVTLRDVDDAAVQRGRDAIAHSLERSHQKGTLSEAVDVVLARLETGIGPADLGEMELVIEAVPEIPTLKRSVLTQVAAGVSVGTVIATNTSSISISELADVVSAPGRFLGMHFFNPVPVSSLVELIRGPLTSEATIEAARGWARSIGKSEIVANDVPGFATSRLGVAIGLEAIRMLEEGVASADDIDRGMMLGYGFPVGPLRLTDIVGLDVRLEIAEYLSRTLGDRFEPPTLLRKKVRDGQLGRKSGRGFYEWVDTD